VCPAPRTDFCPLIRAVLHRLTRLPRSVYTALIVSILLSTSEGLVYGFLRHDFGAGFTIASYTIACLALVLALIAASDFVGMETPDSFAANDVYEKNMEIDDRDFEGRVGAGKEYESTSSL
jgi:ABC-type uncharacterized transport system permease subunit